MIIESHAHYSHKRFDGAFRYLTGELTARASLESAGAP